MPEQHAALDEQQQYLGPSNCPRTHKQSITSTSYLLSGAGAVSQGRQALLPLCLPGLPAAAALVRAA
jgi:hypothetical protein